MKTYNLKKILFAFTIFIAASLTLISYEKVIKLRFSAKNYKTIEVENINGSVIVEAKKTDFIGITAIITGRKENVKQTRIVDYKSPNKIKVEAKFPRESKNLNVSFTVEVPEVFNLVVSTINGKINIDGLSGRVKLSTVNGRIEGEMKEVKGGKFITVNGSIELFVDKFSGDSYFKTVNGGVNVKSLFVDNLKVIARSVNGSIKIKNKNFVKIEDMGATIFSIPIPPRKRIAYGKSPKFEIKISTVNGSIHFE